MRSVLIVFGIAIGILVLAIVFTPSKNLVDNPADEAWKRQQEYDRQQAAEAKKAAAAKGGTSAAAPTATAATPNPMAASSPAPGASQPASAPAKGTVTAVMTVKDRGDITLEMFPKEAPKTVAQISSLIKKGFYDGIVIHRVEPGFVVQFGNPATKTQGANAPEEDGGVPTIPFEKNSLKHGPGGLSIALTSPQSDTGTSQIFIDLGGNDRLNGDYAVFGKVASGMDVVQKLQVGDVISRIVLK
jgi:peptidyl-prolyl cis-trans isomerase B (cyclophilin B)